MQTLEQAEKLKDEAYWLHDCLFEILEDMKPNSKTYKRILATHNRAHLRWQRREKVWLALGGSYG